MKRPRDEGSVFVQPTNETGKALFVRDASGELVTVLPGEPMPALVRAASEASQKVVEKSEAMYEGKRLEERSEEDIQYEAYMNSKDGKRGNIWLQNAGMGASDRAAFCDSLAAEVAEHRESGKEYKPSKAHDRGAKMKKQSGRGSSGFLGGTSVESAKLGAQKANEAMAKALEASDDDEGNDGSLTMNAVQMANRAMEMYNLPISNLAQADVHGNDLRLPKLQRKLRKFLECFAEDVAVKTAAGASVLKDFEAVKKRYGTVFRESGATLRGEVRRRWYFEAAAEDGEDEEGSGESYCIDFEQHTSLVSPRLLATCHLPLATCYLLPCHA